MRADVDPELFCLVSFPCFTFRQKTYFKLVSTFRTSDTQIVPQIVPSSHYHYLKSNSCFKSSNTLPSSVSLLFFFGLFQSYLSKSSDITPKMLRIPVLLDRFMIQLWSGHFFWIYAIMKAVIDTATGVAKDVPLSLSHCSVVAGDVTDLMG